MFQYNGFKSALLFYVRSSGLVSIPSCLRYVPTDRRRLGSPRFGPLLARCVSSRFGRAPILVRPASELNRFLRSNWSSAARNSTTTSFGRAVHSGSLSLISKSVRPSFGHQGGRLDPQRNGALHRSTRHGADQFSTARRSAAQGRPAQRSPLARHQHRRCFQRCHYPSPNLGAFKRIRLVPVSIRLVSIRSVSVRSSSRFVLVRLVLLPQFVASRFAAFRLAPCAVRFLSVWTCPPLGVSRFETDSVLEVELVECRARFDYDQLWASPAFGQFELKIKIRSAKLRGPLAP